MLLVSARWRKMFWVYGGDACPETLWFVSAMVHLLQIDLGVPLMTASFVLWPFLLGYDGAFRWGTFSPSTPVGPSGTDCPRGLLETQACGY